MSVETPNRRKEVQHDETPAIIQSHAFIPRNQWWSLCKICGLAQAAHQSTTLRAPFEYYGDDSIDEE